MLLCGKVAIVTGGGRGIGKAIVKRFAAEGASVILAQRDVASAEETCRQVAVAGGNALFVAADIADAAAVQAVVATAVGQLGGVDILVNNAAILGENGPFLDLSQETWERVLAVNLTGAFLCAQAAARAMVERGGGSIINVSSTNAHVPQPRCSAYAAAKGGLESLTRAMAVDLAPQHIRVNTLAPGPVQSRVSEDLPPRATSATLLGRFGLTSEVAAAALFLASDQSAFITGQTLGVDGGVLINSYRLFG